MTGVLIREIFAHQSVITSLSKIELNDGKMLLSSSKDCKVRVWSMDLDLQGNINGKTEKDDPKW
jgi:WD40 repeat protein